MPLEFALGIVCAVLRGLDYAHRRTGDRGEPLGIVHRDVSPSNVLVSYEGEIKLCDFGIALANQAVQGEREVAGATDALQGKAGYMSPEHARGEAIDARGDVFSAGILLWELLSGRRMYQKDREPSLLEQARRADVPPLAPRGLPNEESLRKIATRALAPAREDRYPSAAALLRDLEAYMSEAHLVASPLRLGGWLESTFGTELVSRRRARQRAALALAKGPPVVLTPLEPLPEPALVETPPATIQPAVLESTRPNDITADGTRTPRGRAAWVALAAMVALVLAYALLSRAP